MGGSDFLFATPSFKTGAGRVLDLWASLENYSYNFSRTPGEADCRAIGADWAVIGKDLQEAFDAVQKKYGIEPLVAAR